MDTTSNILVELYFLQVIFGTGILALWFLGKKSKVLKDFGLGLACYFLGVTIWTAAVITKPENLQPIILLGVVPFLLAHLAYARAASAKLRSKSQALIGITLLLIAATFIARSFFYKSDPYFSDQGLLFFGLQPVPIALYIATISVSFLPAIRAVVAEIKDKMLKSVFSIGFTTIYVNSIILVSAKDDSLLLINGVVMTIALLVLWVKAYSTPVKA